MKERIFLENIIIPYHKDFKQNAELSRFALKNPMAFNVEELYEQTMNMLTGFVRVIKDHHLDAIKGKYRLDWKTGSVMPSPQNSDSKNSYATHITRVRSDAGILKTADICASVYNPHTASIDHFLIPENSLENMVNSSGDIRGTWHNVKGYAHKMSRYQLSFNDIIAELRSR